MKRLVALDEGRFGLISWLRRRWCPLGERPPWIVQDDYEWLWLYAAVEPTTGTGVFLLLPTVEGACLELFLQHLRHELGEGPIGVVRLFGPRTCIRFICHPTVPNSIPPSRSSGISASTSPIPCSRPSTSCKTRSSTNSSSSGSIRRCCSTSPTIPGGSRPSTLTYHLVPERV